MSYLVFARKYRPMDFTSVVGQEHVIKTLKNAVKRDKIAHAYVFSGPRGVGKTSIARIFSKSLNCQKGPTPDPCGECVNCNEIAQGISLAVREIDGASHNSVDNVRELIESFRALPPPGYLYKIYIIDEVHMLSTSAFNALLKSLEEPPPNTVFILATTEVHKIPDTVLSRCQKHELHALPTQSVLDQLSQIVKKEKVKCEESVLRTIARLSEGSLRDAESLLDRVVAFCEDNVTEAEVSKVLGVVERKTLEKITESIIQRDPEAGLRYINQVFQGAIDTALFLKDFSSHWRDLLIAKHGGDSLLKELGFADEDRTELIRIVSGISGEDLQDLVTLATSGADTALRSYFPKYSLEALIVRMATRETSQELGELLNRIDNLELSSKKDVFSSTIPKQAPKITSTQIQRSDTPKNTGVGLDWFSFVKNLSKSDSRIVVEHVKRLSILVFEAGNLEATGPKFTVDSLSKGEAREKLIKALEHFSGIPNWKVNITIGLDAPLNLSVKAKEELDANAAIKARQTDASQHPAVQSLKKAFPGTKIESIRIKE